MMRFLILLLFVLAGCKGPYDAAWRTTDAVLKARNLTAQQLAQAAQKKHVECKAKHGVKTAGFANCIDNHRKALKHWQDIARPAINSACQITAASLTIAERAKSKIDWMVLLKPAMCAFLRVFRFWGHYLPVDGKAILRLMPLLEGVTCE
jgi:hypothetical protein